MTADEGDWYNNWDTSVETRTNVGTFASDPRTSFRGSGTIEINYGTMTMIGNPRLYVDNTSFGWKNVEMTGYATWISDGTGGDLTSVAGFVMGARSKHDVYGQEGFVRLQRNTIMMYVMLHGRSSVGENACTFFRRNT